MLMALMLPRAADIMLRVATPRHAASMLTPLDAAVVFFAFADATLPPFAMLRLRHRVGDGAMSLCHTRGCYICRHMMARAAIALHSG